MYFYSCVNGSIGQLQGRRDGVDSGEEECPPHFCHTLVPEIYANLAVPISAHPSFLIWRRPSLASLSSLFVKISKHYSF